MNRLFMMHELYRVYPISWTTLTLMTYGELFKLYREVFNYAKREQFA